MSVADRIRVKNVRVLSDNYATLKDTTFEWRRAAICRAEYFPVMPPLARQR